ncbi:MAG: TolC family protein [Treponema sp.]|nr:TolC family protein [Treponema sp.]
MKQHRTLLVAALICISASFLTAQETQKQEKSKIISLTVNTAVQMALDTNITIQREKIQLNQTKRNYDHSWNKVLPSINASLSGTPAGELSQSDKNTILTKAGVTASLTLTTGLGAQIKKLKANYKAGLASYEDTVRNTEIEVRQAFYQLLYKKEVYDVAVTNQQSYQQAYDLTKTKRDHGMVPEIDLLTAQVNLESAKLDTTSAQIDYMTCLIEFIDTIGVEPDPDMEIHIVGTLDVADTVSDIPFDVALEAKNTSSEIRILKEQLEVAKLTKADTALSSYLPSLTLSGSVYPYESTQQLSSNTTTKSDSWSASIGITIPLDSYIPGSSKSDSIKDAKDTIQDLELQIKDKSNSITTDVINKQQSIKLSKETLESRHLKVELAKQQLELTQEAYNKGTKDLETLTSAMDSYRSAQLDLRSQQYNLLNSVLELESTISCPANTYIKDTD